MMAETLEQGQVDIQVQGQEDIQVYGPILGHFLCRLGGTMGDREVTLEAAREGDIFTGRPLTVEGKYRYFLVLTGQKLDSSCAGVNEGETDSTDIRITVNGVKMDTHPSINKEALVELEDVFMKANMED